jgi:hypothetical protein
MEEGSVAVGRLISGSCGRVAAPMREAAGTAELE